MICGVCHPETFRPAVGKRVFGYLAYSSDRAAVRGGAAPDLYFMGAEFVLADIAKGNVTRRPGYQLLYKVMRAPYA